MNLKRLDDLILSYQDESISEKDFEELDELLKKNPEAAKRYLWWCAQSTALREMTQVAAPATATPTRSPRRKTRKPVKAAASTPMGSWALGAVATLLLGVLLWWTMQPTRKSPEPKHVKKPTIKKSVPQPEKQLVEKPEPKDEQKVEPKPEPKPESEIRQGRTIVAEGRARPVPLPQGGTLTLDSGAEIKGKQDDVVALLKGRVQIALPATSKLTLQISNGSLTGEGCDFAIDWKPGLESLRVTKGEIFFTPARAPEPEVRLGRGQYIQMVNGKPWIGHDPSMGQSTALPATIRAPKGGVIKKFPKDLAEKFDAGYWKDQKVPGVGRGTIWPVPRKTSEVPGRKHFSITSGEESFGKNYRMNRTSKVTLVFFAPKKISFELFLLMNEGGGRHTVFNFRHRIHPQRIGWQQAELQLSDFIIANTNLPQPQDWNALTLKRWMVDIFVKRDTQLRVGALLIKP